MTPANLETNYGTMHPFVNNSPNEWESSAYKTNRCVQHLQCCCAILVPAVLSFAGIALGTYTANVVNKEGDPSTNFLEGGLIGGWIGLVIGSCIGIKICCYSKR